MKRVCSIVLSLSLLMPSLVQITYGTDIEPIQEISLSNGNQCIDPLLLEQNNSGDCLLKYLEYKVNKRTGETTYVGQYDGDCKKDIKNDGNVVGLLDKEKKRIDDQIKKGQKALPGKINMMKKLGGHGAAESIDTSGSAGVQKATLDKLNEYGFGSFKAINPDGTKREVIELEAVTDKNAGVIQQSWTLSEDFNRDFVVRPKGTDYNFLTMNFQEKDYVQAYGQREVVMDHHKSMKKNGGNAGNLDVKDLVLNQYPDRLEFVNTMEYSYFTDDQLEKFSKGVEAGMVDVKGLIVDDGKRLDLMQGNEEVAEHINGLLKKRLDEDGLSNVLCESEACQKKYDTTQKTLVLEDSIAVSLIPNDINSQQVHFMQPDPADARYTMNDIKQRFENIKDVVDAENKLASDEADVCEPEQPQINSFAPEVIQGREESTGRGRNKDADEEKVECIPAEFEDRIIRLKAGIKNTFSTKVDDMLQYKYAYVNVGGELTAIPLPTPPYYPCCDGTRTSQRDQCPTDKNGSSVGCGGDENAIVTCCNLTTTTDGRTCPIDENGEERRCTNDLIEPVRCCDGEEKYRGFECPLDENGVNDGCVDVEVEEVEEEEEDDEMSYFDDEDEWQFKDDITQEQKDDFEKFNKTFMDAVSEFIRIDTGEWKPIDGELVEVIEIALTKEEITQKKNELIELLNKKYDLLDELSISEKKDSNDEFRSLYIEWIESDYAKILEQLEKQNGSNANEGSSFDTQSFTTQSNEDDEDLWIDYWDRNDKQISKENFDRIQKLYLNAEEAFDEYADYYNEMEDGWITPSEEDFKALADNYQSIFETYYETILPYLTEESQEEAKEELLTDVSEEISKDLETLQKILNGEDLSEEDDLGDLDDLDDDLGDLDDDFGSSDDEGEGSVGTDEGNDSDVPNIREEEEFREARSDLSDEEQKAIQDAYATFITTLEDYISVINDKDLGLSKDQLLAKKALYIDVIGNFYNSLQKYVTSDTTVEIREEGKEILSDITTTMDRIINGINEEQEEQEQEEQEEEQFEGLNQSDFSTTFSVPGCERFSVSLNMLSGEISTAGSCDEFEGIGFDIAGYARRESSLMVYFPKSDEEDRNYVSICEPEPEEKEDEKPDFKEKECEDGETRRCGVFVTGDAPSEYDGVGQCRDGSQACFNGSWSLECIGEVLPEAEVCDDGIDNDCNGKTDQQDDQCNIAQGGCFDTDGDGKNDIDPKEITPETLALISSKQTCGCYQEYDLRSNIDEKYVHFFAGEHTYTFPVNDIQGGINSSISISSFVDVDDGSGKKESFEKLCPEFIPMLKPGTRYVQMVGSCEAIEGFGFSDSEETSKSKVKNYKSMSSGKNIGSSCGVGNIPGYTALDQEKQTSCCRQTAVYECKPLPRHMCGSSSSAYAMDRMKACQWVGGDQGECKKPEARDGACNGIQTKDICIQDSLCNWNSECDKTTCEGPKITPETLVDCNNLGGDEFLECQEQKAEYEEKQQETFKMLNGFTLGNSYVRSKQAKVRILGIRVGSYDIYVGAGYGFGIRIPFEATVTVENALGAGGVSVSTEIEPKDASPSYYKDVGLPTSKVFGGKEFVLMAGAYAAAKVKLVGVTIIDLKCDLLRLIMSKLGIRIKKPGRGVDDVTDDDFFDFGGSCSFGGWLGGLFKKSQEEKEDREATVDLKDELGKDTDPSNQDGLEPDEVTLTSQEINQTNNIGRDLREGKSEYLQNYQNGGADTSCSKRAMSQYPLTKDVCTIVKKFGIPFYSVLGLSQNEITDMYQKDLLEQKRKEKEEKAAASSGGGTQDKSEGGETQGDVQMNPGNEVQSDSKSNEGWMQAAKNLASNEKAMALLTTAVGLIKDEETREGLKEGLANLDPRDIKFNLKGIGQTDVVSSQNNNVVTPTSIDFSRDLQWSYNKPETLLEILTSTRLFGIKLGDVADAGIFADIKFQALATLKKIIAKGTCIGVTDCPQIEYTSTQMKQYDLNAVECRTPASIMSDDGDPLDDFGFMQEFIANVVIDVIIKGRVRAMIECKYIKKPLNIASPWVELFKFEISKDFNSHKGTKGKIILDEAGKLTQVEGKVE